jgi:Phosphoesterase family
MLSRRKFIQISAASSGLAITGTDLLTRAAANASSTVRPLGSRGIRHIVILMMENRSFDHFLGWLPGADGRHDLTYTSLIDGNRYPNYPLAPDFQGCGYSDPDHSWEGWLVQHNHGKMDGFLQRPTAPANNPGVTLAAANTFPIGYYTNLHHDGSHKALPDLLCGRACEVRLQFGQLIGEVRGRQPFRVAPQRPRRRPVGAGSPPDPQIDPSGVHRLQRAELLRHGERRMVGKHHPARADPNRRRGRRDLADEDGWCRAGDARHVVMLCDPVPGEAPPLGVPSQVDAPAQRLAGRLPGRHRAQVEHREGDA